MTRPSLRLMAANLAETLIALWVAGGDRCRELQILITVAGCLEALYPPQRA